MLPLFLQWSFLSSGWESRAQLSENVEVYAQEFAAIAENFHFLGGGAMLMKHFAKLDKCNTDLDELVDYYRKSLRRV